MNKNQKNDPARIKSTFFPSQKKAFAYLLIVWGVYAFVTFVTPIDPDENIYELSTAETNLIRLSFLIPILLIWGAALSGAVGVRTYAKSIVDDEKNAWDNIAKGLYAFLAAIIIGTLFQTIAVYLDSISESVQVVTTNYIQTVFYLIGYFYIYRGSSYLLRTVDVKRLLDTYLLNALVVSAVLTVTYVYAVFQNEYRTVSDNPDIIPTYYLEDPALFATIILPTVIGWVLGIVAIVNLMMFRRNVSGVIYRKALKKLYIGLATLVGFAVGLQLLVQASASFLNLSLPQLLGLIYAILLAWAVAYVMIAQGSRKLLKLEEV